MTRTGWRDSEVFFLVLYTAVFFGIAGFALRDYQCLHHSQPSAVVVDLRAIGAACTMKEATFGPDVITGGEKTAWYWRDAQGHFCADMHHVHNPNIGMDDWRSVYVIGIDSKAVFEHEADAVAWVNSQRYVYKGTL